MAGVDRARGGVVGGEVREVPGTNHVGPGGSEGEVRPKFKWLRGSLQLWARAQPKL